MKGLILKDFICMKKKLFTFAYLLVAAIVIAVMFVLSVEHGNIGLMQQKMIADGETTAQELESIIPFGLVMFLILPFASICDPSASVIADRKMGFTNVSAALPINTRKRVLAKYIVMFSQFIVAGVIDLVIALFLSRISALIQFTKFTNMIMFLIGLLTILTSLTYVFLFWFGNGKETSSIILSTILLFIPMFAILISKMKQGDEAFMDFLQFPTEKGYVVGLVSAGFAILSYFVCAALAEKKRGLV